MYQLEAMMDDLDAMAIAWKRERIAEKLRLCTEKQRAFFDKLYPNGPKDSQLANAYDQIVRTLKKNASTEEE